MAKKVLISGGSSGIGQGTAYVFAREGWDVAISYNKNRDGAELTKKNIEEMGGKCFIIEAHLEQEGAPEAMVKEARKLLGGLDAFVSNAGRDNRNSILTTTREDMMNIISTNFLGYMLACGEAARTMVRDGTQGSIIFITSTRAESPHPDDFLYGGIKASVKRAVESIALDLSPYNIRVNCVAPGATKVRDDAALLKKIALNPDRKYYPLEDIIPLRRRGLPEDVGQAVFFLASDKSTYITGTTIRVDGGLVLPALPEGHGTSMWLNPDWVKRHREGMEKFD